MIAKKTKKADLERKRFAFFQIGLIVAGSLTLAAFEYTTASASKKKVVVLDDGPTWSPSTDIIPEDILDSRPQPKESSLQTRPTDDVIIAKNVIPTKTTFVPIIVKNDPCSDCDDDLVLIPETTSPEIFDFVSHDPSFPGGVDEMTRFIQTHVVFPSICKEMNKGGTVFVEFVVNTDGSICNVKSANVEHPELMKEAERVVKMMPNWIPGENYGKKVRVRYTIPINFVVR